MKYTIFYNKDKTKQAEQTYYQKIYRKYDDYIPITYMILISSFLIGIILLLFNPLLASTVMLSSVISFFTLYIRLTVLRNRIDNDESEFIPKQTMKHLNEVLELNHKEFVPAYRLINDKSSTQHKLIIDTKDKKVTNRYENKIILNPETKTERTHNLNVKSSRDSFKCLSNEEMMSYIDDKLSKESYREPISTRYKFEDYYDERDKKMASYHTDIERIINVYSVEDDN